MHKFKLSLLMVLVLSTLLQGSVVKKKNAIGYASDRRVHRSVEGVQGDQKFENSTTNIEKDSSKKETPRPEQLTVSTHTDEVSETNFDGSGYTSDFDSYETDHEVNGHRHDTDVIAIGFDLFGELARSAMSTIFVGLAQIFLAILEGICKPYKMICIAVASFFKSVVENSKILSQFSDILIANMPPQIFSIIAGSDILFGGMK